MVCVHAKRASIDSFRHSWWRCSCQPQTGQMASTAAILLPLIRYPPTKRNYRSLLFRRKSGIGYLITCVCVCVCVCQCVPFVSFRSAGTPPDNFSWTTASITQKQRRWKFFIKQTMLATTVRYVVNHKRTNHSAVPCLQLQDDAKIPELLTTVRKIVPNISATCLTLTTTALKIHRCDS